MSKIREDQNLRPPSPNSREIQMQNFARNIDTTQSRPFSFTENQLFIFLNLELQFDWAKKEFRLKPDEKVKELYRQKNPSLDADSYENDFKLLELNINKRLNYIINDSKIGPKKMEDIKIYSSDTWKREDISKIKEKYYAYSPYRVLDLKSNPDSNIVGLLIGHLIDVIVKKSIDDIYGDIKLYETAPPKLSEINEQTAYLRDDIIALGDKTFQPHSDLMDAYL